MYFTGTDSANGFPFPFVESLVAKGELSPRHFYIGRQGGGLNSSLTYWDEHAAKQANYVAMYWDLQGPLYATDRVRYSPALIPTNAAVKYGQKQAGFALRAYHHLLRKIPILFFDVESGNPGWSADIHLNYAVLESACQFIQEHDIAIGVYISAFTWKQYFGSLLMPARVKLWLAGTNCPGSIFNASVEFNRLTNVGGVKPLLWQYALQGCPEQPNADYNISDVDPQFWGLSVTPPIPGMPVLTSTDASTDVSLIKPIINQIESMQNNLSHLYTQLLKIWSD